MSTTTKALKALEQIARATCKDVIDHGIVDGFVATIRAALEEERVQMRAYMTADGWKADQLPHDDGGRPAILLFPNGGHDNE